MYEKAPCAAWWSQNTRKFGSALSGKNRSILCLRYVDDHLCISEPAIAALPGVQLFLNDRCCGGDISFEDEPGFDFVGFTLGLQNRCVLYNRVCQAWDLPSVGSASPENVLLSGMLARAHTIKLCSFPEAQMLMDLRHLWELENEQRLPINSFALRLKLSFALRSTVLIVAKSDFCAAGQPHCPMKTTPLECDIRRGCALLTYLQ